MSNDVFLRKAADFKDSKRFTISSKTFEKQLSSIYLARLTALKDEVVQKAKNKWAPHRILQLEDLPDAEQDGHYIIIGTLYKNQELKPSVLRELSEEMQIAPQPLPSTYASHKDTLFLEDESLSVKLSGDHINIQEVVTGLVCAILGCKQGDSSFWVEDYCFPGCPLSSMSHLIPNMGGKILLISSLDFANNADSVSLDLLLEWITGMVGGTEVQQDEASVIRVIIAGNSVRGSIELYNHKGYLESKTYNQASAKESALAANRFDNFLSTIAETCCITLMPGEFDPTSHTLPQQPFHPCIVPKSAKFKSFHGATNPWIGRIDSRIVAGSSGQPIMDVMKVASLAVRSPLEWLEQTLIWRHYAPTAPDTLPAYACFNTDPFIMEECPDIYFVGNMNDYDTKIITGEEGQVVRLICIPKFSETRTAVLVDLNDLNTNSISFGVS